MLEHAVADFAAYELLLGYLSPAEHANLRLVSRSWQALVDRSLGCLYPCAIAPCNFGFGSATSLVYKSLFQSSSIRHHALDSRPVNGFHAIARQFTALHTLAVDCINRSCDDFEHLRLITGLRRLKLSQFEFTDEAFELGIAPCTGLQVLHLECQQAMLQVHSLFHLSGLLQLQELCLKPRGYINVPSESAAGVLALSGLTLLTQLILTTALRPARASSSSDAGGLAGPLPDFSGLPAGRPVYFDAATTRQLSKSLSNLRRLQVLRLTATAEFPAAISGLTHLKSLSLERIGHISRPSIVSLSNLQQLTALTVITSADASDMSPVPAINAQQQQQHWQAMGPVAAAAAVGVGAAAGALHHQLADAQQQLQQQQQQQQHGDNFLEQVHNNIPPPPAAGSAAGGLIDGGFGGSDDGLYLPLLQLPKLQELVLGCVARGQALNVTTTLTNNLDPPEYVDLTSNPYSTKSSNTPWPLQQHTEWTNPMQLSLLATVHRGLEARRAGWGLQQQQHSSRRRYGVLKPSGVGSSSSGTGHQGLAARSPYDHQGLPSSSDLDHHEWFFQGIGGQRYLHQEGEMTNAYVCPDKWSELGDMEGLQHVVVEARGWHSAAVTARYNSLDQAVSAMMTWPAVGPPTAAAAAAAHTSSSSSAAAAVPYSCGAVGVFINHPSQHGYIPSLPQLLVLALRPGMSQLGLLQQHLVRQHLVVVQRAGLHSSQQQLLLGGAVPLPESAARRLLLAQLRASMHPSKINVVLAASATQLRRLELTVDQAWPSAVLASVGQLQKLPHLEMLKLDCGRQDPPDELWEGVSSLVSLKWLCLRWLEGLPVSCLAGLTKLVVLQLKAINKPPGAAELAEVMAGMPDLQALAIEGSLLDVEGDWLRDTAGLLRHGRWTSSWVEHTLCRQQRLRVLGSVTAALLMAIVLNSPKLPEMVCTAFLAAISGGIFVLAVAASLLSLMLDPVGPAGAAAAAAAAAAEDTVTAGGGFSWQQLQQQASDLIAAAGGGSAATAAGATDLLDVVAWMCSTVEWLQQTWLYRCWWWCYGWFVCWMLRVCWRICCYCWSVLMSHDTQTTANSSSSSSNSESALPPAASATLNASVDVTDSSSSSSNAGAAAEEEESEASAGPQDSHQQQQQQEQQQEPSQQQLEDQGQCDDDINIRDPVTCVIPDPGVAFRRLKYFSLRRCTITCRTRTTLIGHPSLELSSLMSRLPPGFWSQLVALCLGLLLWPLAAGGALSRIAASSSYQAAGAAGGMWSGLSILAPFWNRQQQGAGATAGTGGRNANNRGRGLFAGWGWYWDELCALLQAAANKVEVARVGHGSALLGLVGEMPQLRFLDVTWLNLEPWELHGLVQLRQLHYLGLGKQQIGVVLSAEAQLARNLQRGWPGRGRRRRRRQQGFSGALAGWGLDSLLITPFLWLRWLWFAGPWAWWASRQVRGHAAAAGYGNSSSGSSSPDYVTGGLHGSPGAAVFGRDFGACWFGQDAANMVVVEAPAGFDEVLERDVMAVAADFG